MNESAHIAEDRMHQFAIEAVDLTKWENTHLDDCAECWGRLVVAVQLAILTRAETDIHLVM